MMNDFCNASFNIGECKSMVLQIYSQKIHLIHSSTFTAPVHTVLRMHCYHTSGKRTCPSFCIDFSVRQALAWSGCIVNIGDAHLIYLELFWLFWNNWDICYAFLQKDLTLWLPGWVLLFFPKRLHSFFGSRCVNIWQ